MSTSIEQPRTNWQGVEMSVQEFLTLPDDGIHRELVQGRVREDRERWEDGKKGSDVTVRNRFHSRIVIRVGQLLANWMDLQPEPRGEVETLSVRQELTGDTYLSGFRVSVARLFA